MFFHSFSLEQRGSDHNDCNRTGIGAGLYSPGTEKMAGNGAMAEIHPDVGHAGHDCHRHRPYASSIEGR